MSLQSLQKQAQTFECTPEMWTGSADSEGFVAADTAGPILNWKTSTAALAIWRRALPVGIIHAIDHLPLNTVEGWRLTTDVEVLQAGVRKAMSSCGIEHEELRRYFASDMCRLARVFVAGTGVQQLEVRFEVVKNDACSKFHTDNYPERLAVTYTGPGTVAVPSDYAEDALQEQQAYSGPILEIPRIWAALFAGKREDRAGLVHRSPRIAGTGQSRLFFCMNAARS